MVYVQRMLSFQRLATLSSIVCFELAATWAVTPWLVPLLWSVDDTVPAAVFGRQSGALFLGFAIVFWRVRKEPASSTRDALVYGFVVCCLALAGLSLYELASGHAWFGILSAVVVELFLAFGFLRTVLAER